MMNTTSSRTQKLEEWKNVVSHDVQHLQELINWLREEVERLNDGVVAQQAVIRNEPTSILRGLEQKLPYLEQVGRVWGVTVMASC